MSEAPRAEPAPTVAAAIGQYIRYYRKEYGVTIDALARVGSALGMTWGRTSIENIESGKFAPTISTLFALCAALNAQRWDDNTPRIRLPDLFSLVDTVSIADGYEVSTDRIRSFLGDPDAVEAVGDWYGDYVRILGSFEPKKPTLAERRAAKRLDVSVEELQDLATYLWGESLDRVVSNSLEPGASAQARGHETRLRVAELRERMPDLWVRMAADRRSDG